MARSELLVCRLVGANALSWSFKRLLNSPSTLTHSRFYRSRVDPILVSKLRNSAGNAVNSIFNISIKVIGLLFLCSPSAVIGGVVAVIVDAINRVFAGRLLAHIRKEVTKTVFSKPSITNLYTSTTVPFILSIPRLVTALFHGSPRVIFQPVDGIPAMRISAIVLALVFASLTALAGVNLLKAGLVAFKNIATRTLNSISSTDYLQDTELTLVYVCHKNSITCGAYRG